MAQDTIAQIAITNPMYISESKRNPKQSKSRGQGWMLTHILRTQFHCLRQIASRSLLQTFM